MKITINGSPKELVELAKLLDGADNEEKKADIPPLLTELNENSTIVRNAKVKPIERTFSSLKSNFQAALSNFFPDENTAETIRNAEQRIQQIKTQVGSFKENVSQNNDIEKEAETPQIQADITNFGKILLKKREESGLSQTILAQLVGISQQTVASYETGYKIPPLRVVVAAADVFRCSTDEMIGRKIS